MRATQRKTPRRRPKVANGEQICYFDALMSDRNTAYTVHAEARGSHWVSWITRGADTKPERGILLIAPSREEAEARARQWAEQTSY
jgi:hypothetical protein